jgi:hypothetical protein
MPVTYSIDPLQRLVRNVGLGVLTDDELRETQRRMVAEEAEAWIAAGQSE